VRRGHAPRVMASLRNIAITILRLQGETNLAKATRGARNYPLRALKHVGLTTTLTTLQTPCPSGRARRPDESVQRDWQQKLQSSDKSPILYLNAYRYRW